MFSLSFFVTVIAVLLMVGLLVWAIGALPFIPAPLGQILKVFIIVIAGIWMISALLGHAGTHPLISG